MFEFLINLVGFLFGILQWGVTSFGAVGGPIVNGVKEVLFITVESYKTTFCVNLPEFFTDLSFPSELVWAIDASFFNCFVLYALILYYVSTTIKLFAKEEKNKYKLSISKAKIWFYLFGFYLLLGGLYGLFIMPTFFLCAAITYKTLEKISMLANLTEN